MYPSENSWKLMEILRREGHHIIIRINPDEADTVTSVGRYGVTLRGYPTFAGSTLDEAIRELGLSRCWESPAAPGERRKVQVADILDKVKELASQYTTPFKSDEIADELGVFPSAVGHALKKLNWPKSQRQATATLPTGQEVPVYVYLPVIR